MGTSGVTRVGRDNRRRAFSRATVLTLLLVLAAAACSKPNNGGSTPTPVLSTAAPSPTTAVTASATPARTPSPTPSAKPAPSPTPRPSVSPTASAAIEIPPSVTSGSTYTTTVGQVLTLTLGIDSGYAWAFTTQPNAAVLAVTNQQILPPASPLASGSSAGLSRFRVTFKAVAPGTTTFALNETQSGNPQPLYMYSLTVVVP